MRSKENDTSISYVLIFCISNELNNSSKIIEFSDAGCSAPEPSVNSLNFWQYYA
jgi:hypothetical protein